MKKLYVICVDDQPEVLSSVARDLQSFADWTTVEECESAKEALELLDELQAGEAPVALIVCDHIMPGTSGVDFLAELAADSRFPHLKKILLTGQATQKDAIEAINRAHIDYYIEKPWSRENLEKACRALLSRYLFDAGLFAEDHRPYVDPEVLMARLRGRE